MPDSGAIEFTSCSLALSTSTSAAPIEAPAMPVASPATIRAAISQSGPLAAANSAMADDLEHERRKDYRLAAEMVEIEPAINKASSSAKA